MVIDLIHKQLREAIVLSYTSGDFDNSLNQLDLSLEIFQKKYCPSRFLLCQTSKDLLAEKIKLLTEVQLDVDEIIGIGNGAWERDEDENGSN